jgi:hypothetical protein
MKPVPAKTAFKIASLQQVPDVRSFGLVSVHAVMAARLCVICAHAERDPSAALAERFGNGLAANRFRLLMTTIDGGWPDVFHVSRPCCLRMTPDEALIATLVQAAFSEDRAAFDRQSIDFLGAELRDQLWLRITGWLRSLPGYQGS